MHSEEGPNSGSENYAGGLVGNNIGVIAACFAAGRVENHSKRGFYGGGLVGRNNSGARITASYATGTVTTPSTANTGVGGLVGWNVPVARIIASYATGSVQKPGQSYTGGLIGRRSDSNNQVTNSYWDRQTTGRSDAFFGIWGSPRSTADLKGPTGYWGIYSGWNQNVDGQGGADDPWDFGTSSDYPVLKFGGLDQAPQRDHDRDDNNLIEIYNLSQLDAVRHDLGGAGAVDDASSADDASAYSAAFVGHIAQMGCADACAGYELIASLNFDTDGDGSADRDDQFWDDGKGWQPIGAAAAPYDTEFAGNGHSLSNLFISRGDAENVGLFGAVGSAASIYALALPDAGVTGSRTAAGNVGALAGKNEGALAASFVTGAVAGSANDSVGGLVGRNAGDGTIRAVYSRAAVSAGSSGDAGGIVGYNDGGAIAASYALGAVSGGGAVGRNSPGGTATNVYWNTAATGQNASAGSPASAGKTAAQLQEPVDYASIYANWNLNLDGETGGDTPWDFGVSIEYPALIYAGMQNAPPAGLRPGRRQPD